MQIIYLNGTSSCGKLTLSRALAVCLLESVVISADAFGEQFDQVIDHKAPAYQNLIHQYECCEQKIAACQDDSARTALFEDYYHLLNTQPLPRAFNSGLAVYEQIVQLAEQQCVIVDDLIATPF